MPKMLVEIKARFSSCQFLYHFKGSFFSKVYSDKKILTQVISDPSAIYFYIHTLPQSLCSNITLGIIFILLAGGVFCSEWNLDWAQGRTVFLKWCATTHKIATTYMTFRHADKSLNSPESM